MNHLIKRCGAVVVLTLAFLAPAAHADFGQGVLALSMGEYEKALETFVPLAETSNHAFAQYFLARMYAAGQGVEPNPQTAAKWYRKAAEQGVADAQFRLGQLYEQGKGVPTDMEYAFGWYSVSAHLGNQHGRNAQQATRQKMSDTELVEAEKLSRDLISKFGKVAKGTARQQ